VGDVRRRRDALDQSAAHRRAPPPRRAVPTRAKQAVRVALFSLYMLLLLHGHDALWIQASLAERVVFITVAL
jgi:hypothetical protein